MNYKQIRTNLLSWYDSHNREMPWRGESDAYKIWVSEIMLQQTQITTVIDYYNRWIKRFPRIEDVASASLDEILKYWEGLGYYSRARNFHQSCQKIIETSSIVPDSIEEFQKLKGVGPYIASAVQSIAYNIPSAVIDGNVNRVISRINIYDINPLKNKKKIQSFMDKMLCKIRPGDFNQAIMDLGRYVCKPRTPLCDECPLKTSCKAYKTNQQSLYPIKVKTPPKPHYNVAVGIIWDKSKILITKRKENGLLGGLWEFPGGKMKKRENAFNAVRREIKEELSINIIPRELIQEVEHHYSHFSVTIQAIDCIYKSGNIKLNGPTDYKWVTPPTLHEFAFPKASIKLFQSIKGIE